MHIFVLHMIIIVEVVNMTNNTQFKTLLNTWLNQKKPMITPSTHASFTLIAENHLIPEYSARDCAPQPLKLSIHSGGIEHPCRCR